ncbi:MAG: hypothetical protein HY796_08925 [Elusimicrobia bacterium]|nr:hypothetical protein [Elusimicrobiota bacterium]
MAIKTGLIGKPLKRSLSPRLFNIFSGLLDEKFSYTLKEVGPPGLGKAIEEIKKSGWRGFNVTLPLKERVSPFLAKAHKDAEGIGAVNAVLIRDGALEGFNTDAKALEYSLKEVKAGVRGVTCVIWGAGGAAKAAAWTLAARGAGEIRIYNRSYAKARALASYFSKQFPRVRFKAGNFFSPVPAKAAVFINATPLGMYKPLPPALKVPDLKTGLYCDFAYAPGGTPFLKDRPGKTITGLDLLIYQALASAALWSGRRLSAGEIVKLKNKARDACLDI